MWIPASEDSILCWETIIEAIILETPTIKGKFARTFGSNPSPFVNDVITDIQPHFGD